LLTFKKAKARGIKQNITKNPAKTPGFLRLFFLRGEFDFFF